MSKKLTILFITTLILALVFFSGYLVVQEVRGKVVSITSPINMDSGLIAGLPKPTVDTDALTKACANNPGDCGGLCFTADTTLLAAQGLGPFCVTSWCQINDFSWCSGGGYDPPPDDPPVSSFTAQTPILMADGTHKPIKDVKQGDWILTKENEQSNKMVPAKVTKTLKHTIHSYYRIINHKLEVTDTHPIFVDGRWKQAWTIKLGNKLLNEESQEIAVESIKLKRATTEVYNLEIEQYETYFANGFYVHNKPYQL